MDEAVAREPHRHQTKITNCISVADRSNSSFEFSAVAVHRHRSSWRAYWRSHPVPWVASIGSIGIDTEELKQMRGLKRLGRC